MKLLLLAAVLVAIGLVIAVIIAREWREEDRLPNFPPDWEGW